MNQAILLALQAAPVVESGQITLTALGSLVVRAESLPGEVVTALGSGGSTIRTQDFRQPIFHHLSGKISLSLVLNIRCKNGHHVITAGKTFDFAALSLLQASSQMIVRAKSRIDLSYIISANAYAQTQGKAKAQVLLDINARGEQVNFDEDEELELAGVL